MVIRSQIKLNNSCGPGEKAVIFCVYIKTVQYDIKNLLFQTKFVLFNQKKNRATEIKANSPFFPESHNFKTQNIYFAPAERK